MANIDSILEKNIALFNERTLNCAETVLISMCEYMGIDDPILPRVATAFGGGLAGTQSVCGAITGGLMAIGIYNDRMTGGEQLAARRMGADFIKAFKAAEGALSCRELTGIDMSDSAAMKSFRAPGGGHEKVCTACVRWACHYLAAIVDGGEK